LNKPFICFWIIICLCITSVHAVVIDKPLLNVSNCYNLTVSAVLMAGNISPISFSGCSFLGNDSFFCNCYSIDNRNWSLIMQTDNTILRESREYKITVNALVYSFEKDRLRFRIDDWGDYLDLGDIVNESLGDTREKIIIKDIVYVNNTVFQDRIVYQDKIVEKIVYVENTSKVDSCLNELNLTNLTTNLLKMENYNLLNDRAKAEKTANTWRWVSFIIIALVFVRIVIFFINMLWVKK
jgi:hypothetical protein